MTTNQRLPFERLKLELSTDSKVPAELVGNFLGSDMFEHYVIPDEVWLRSVKADVHNFLDQDEIRFSVWEAKESTVCEGVYRDDLNGMVWEGEQLISPWQESKPKSKSMLALKWINYTNKGRPIRNSQDVVWLLRNILNFDEPSSPWHSNNRSCRDMVVLTLPFEPTDNNVRVSDICPSYGLHAVGSMDEYPSFYPTSTVDVSNNISLYVMVFRSILPRERISPLHPVTKEPSKSPFLYETYRDEEKKVLHRLVAPPYFSTDEFPFLKQFLEPQAFSVLSKEAARIPQWTAWPEQDHYASKPDGSSPWHVFPLAYCFPADTSDNLTWVKETAEHCPGTVDLIQTILGSRLRTALWSRLDADSVLEAHTGWADLANHVLRVHIPVDVPPNNLCGTWVDGCVRDSSDIVIFDDSKIHRAHNYSSWPRVVLILDIERPSSFPGGTATGGHSDELDAFIQHFQKPR